jgi:hypothetical protein
MISLKSRGSASAIWFSLIPCAMPGRSTPSSGEVHPIRLVFSEPVRGCLACGLLGWAHASLPSLVRRVMTVNGLPHSFWRRSPWARLHSALGSSGTGSHDVKVDFWQQERCLRTVDGVFGQNRSGVPYRGLTKCHLSTSEPRYTGVERLHLTLGLAAGCCVGHQLNLFWRRSDSFDQWAKLEGGSRSLFPQGSAGQRCLMSWRWCELVKVCNDHLFSGR